LPHELDTDAFRAARRQWREHLEENGKQLTPKRAAKELEFLAPLGEQRAIKAIDHSVRSGWMTIHENADHANGKPVRGPQHKSREEIVAETTRKGIYCK
jgi:hypothetical protein